MNLNIISKILITALLITALFSCVSHEQKADEAFDMVKKEKMLSNENYIFSKDENQDSNKLVIKQIQNLDEWAKFKIEMEKKLVINDKKIKELKVIHNSNQNLIRRAENLEEDNNEIRKQMSEYQAEVKLKWENFKTKMNYDVSEIVIELKDIAINNKN
ncbi:MAG: hypothetical protein A2033_19615 [Bacteroidetes bacterium GWA2_31_9]|nr:MAG: hypothetical protein A2033_19615 [Bacteroidetes bacterium GWA2_31_9]